MEYHHIPKSDCILIYASFIRREYSLFLFFSLDRDQYYFKYYFFISAWKLLFSIVQMQVLTEHHRPLHLMVSIPLFVSRIICCCNLCLSLKSAFGLVCPSVHLKWFPGARAFTRYNYFNFHLHFYPLRVECFSQECEHRLIWVYGALSEDLAIHHSLVYFVTCTLKQISLSLFFTKLVCVHLTVFTNLICKSYYDW